MHETLTVPRIGFEVIDVRQNVLVMQFLGEDGNAAPRLKETSLQPSPVRFHERRIAAMGTGHRRFGCHCLGPALH